MDDWLHRSDGFLHKIDEQILDLKRKKVNYELIEFVKNEPRPETNLLGYLLKQKLSYYKVKVVKVNSELGFKSFKIEQKHPHNNEYRSLVGPPPRFGTFVRLIKLENETNVAFCFEPAGTTHGFCSMMTFDDEGQLLSVEIKWLYYSQNCGIDIVKLADKFLFTVSEKTFYYPFYKFSFRGKEISCLEIANREDDWEKSFLLITDEKLNLIKKIFFEHKIHRMAANSSYFMGFYLGEYFDRSNQIVMVDLKLNTVMEMKSVQKLKNHVNGILLQTEMGEKHLFLLLLRDGEDIRSGDI